jgi:hypothetical protein
MKHTVIDNVHAGMNQIYFAGALSSVATWLPIAAITGIGKNERLVLKDKVVRLGSRCTW